MVTEEIPVSDISDLDHACKKQRFGVGENNIDTSSGKEQNSIHWSYLNTQTILVKKSNVKLSWSALKALAITIIL